MKHLKTFESFKFESNRQEELRNMINDLDLEYLKKSAKTPEDYLKLVEDELGDLQPGDEDIVKQIVS